MNANTNRKSPFAQRAFSPAAVAHRRRSWALIGALWLLGFGSASHAAPDFFDTGSLTTGRQLHTATLLPNGKVLVAGGSGGSSIPASEELYDPASGEWTVTGSLATARQLHTATLLLNGKVLVAGGYGVGGYLASAELYDPASGTWTATGSLATARWTHTATLLPNGKVLVVGGSDVTPLASAELYDPASGTWTATGSLATSRSSASATLLANGKVLVAGGRTTDGIPLASAELYDPASGTWAATGSLGTQRYDHTATLLLNGKVLVAGGTGEFASSVASAELYDPASGTWAATGGLATARADHTATLLSDGKVLVAGGLSDLSDFPVSAELYDPVGATWTAAGSLANARDLASATLLPNGKVLVAGGRNGSLTLASAELYYDPATVIWEATSSLATGRYDHTTTLLANGKVLVAGGNNGSVSAVGSSLASAELYDPASGKWTATGSLATAREGHTATLLPNGMVLVAGGQGDFGSLASAELYDPASGTWTATGSLATSRYLHTATLLPFGVVLVVGGLGDGGSLASVEFYDPEREEWQAIGSLVTARGLHTATILPNGTVLVAGGISIASGGGFASLASAELLDLESATWTATGSLTIGRAGHSATLLPNGKVLVTGGGTGSSSTSPTVSAELYDPASGTWTATGSLAAGHYSHTATLLPSGKVLVVGEIGGSSVCLASAELYDPASGTWTTAASLAAPRYGHTATLLPSGKVLVVGGIATGTTALASAELYDAARGTWAATGDLATVHQDPTSTLLPNGKVLVAGGTNGALTLASAELYDPASGTWTATGSLATARAYHTATLLPNGKVLFAGGTGDGGFLASAEIYDPASGNWSATGSLVTARRSHTATLLPNGKVLVAGGFGYWGNILVSAEIYDPASGTWTATGSLVTARAYHTATLLPNGKVLVTGGGYGGTNLSSTELYDPASGTWSPTGDLVTSRSFLTATLLPNGKVLVAGGYTYPSGALKSAELYDPASGTWTATGSLVAARHSHTATLLPNGKVLAAGGSGFSTLESAELYDPASGTWSATGSLATARQFHMATLLPNGKVLAAGGRGNGSADVFASAELYDVGLGYSAGWQPQISNVSISSSGQFAVTGTGFTGISEASGGGLNNSASNYPVVQVLGLANEQSVFLASDPASNWSATSFTSASVTGLPPGYAMVTVFTNGIPGTSKILNLIPAPVITVTGEGQNIEAGDTTPSSLDGTDFGSATLLSAQAPHSFSIGNAGALALNLTGTPAITFSGAAARDFTVVTSPALVVNPGDSTTFSIRFQPKVPGQRTATVTIASNALEHPSFKFTITGFGLLPTKLAQTITFTPPATLYPAQSPVTLSASASSGLPVTLSLVAPIPSGTTLVNNVLTFTTAGTIKVQADCAASGNYNAAAPVVKTLTVKANPTALTLINLAQVYDGLPKPIATLGGTGSPAITYKVGATFVSQAPKDAGTYSVKAGAVTGTLVIAKAPLTVTPDHKFKLAGRANPALTFSYSGFVNGETSSVITTAPVLKTTATLSSPAGIYPITASGGVAANYNFVYRPANLVIASFAGGYEALLADGSNNLTGKLSLTVASNATNSFSGKLQASTEAAALPITGTLATNLSTDQATSNVVVFNSDGIPYVIRFTLPLSGADAMTATVTRDNEALGSSASGRKLSTATVTYAGAHTAVFEPSTQLGNTTLAGPGGAGWATATISSTGVLTLVGKLGDDTPFTASLSPDTLSNPGYRLFAQPYLAARAQSLIAGAFALAAHPTLTNRRYLVASSLTWQKLGLPADASYRAGFGPLSTVLMIDPWLPPVTKAPVVTLAQRLGLTAPNFGVSHSHTGSASNNNLPIRLDLSGSNVVSVQTPAANLTNWKTLTFLPKTGAFTGSFELTDSIKRTVKFSGVLRQPATGPDTLIGDGSYVLPPLAGTETSTGEVIFTRP